MKSRAYFLRRIGATTRFDPRDAYRTVNVPGVTPVYRINSEPGVENNEDTYKRWCEQAEFHRSNITNRDMNITDESVIKRLIEEATSREGTETAGALTKAEIAQRHLLQAASILRASEGVANPQAIDAATYAATYAAALGIPAEVISEELNGADEEVLKLRTDLIDTFRPALSKILQEMLESNDFAPFLPIEKQSPDPTKTRLCAGLRSDNRTYMFTVQTPKNFKSADIQKDFSKYFNMRNKFIGNQEEVIMRTENRATDVFAAIIGDDDVSRKIEVPSEYDANLGLLNLFYLRMPEIILRVDSQQYWTNINANTAVFIPTMSGAFLQLCTGVLEANATGEDLDTVLIPRYLRWSEITECYKDAYDRCANACTKYFKHHFSENSENLSLLDIFANTDKDQQSYLFEAIVHRGVSEMVDYYNVYYHRDTAENSPVMSRFFESNQPTLRAKWIDHFMHIAIPNNGKWENIPACMSAAAAAIFNKYGNYSRPKITFDDAKELSISQTVGLTGTAAENNVDILRLIDDVDITFEDEDEDESPQRVQTAEKVGGKVGTTSTANNAVGDEGPSDSETEMADEGETEMADEGETAMVDEGETAMAVDGETAMANNLDFDAAINVELGDDELEELSAMIFSETVGADGDDNAVDEQVQVPVGPSSSTKVAGADLKKLTANTNKDATDVAADGNIPTDGTVVVGGSPTSVRIRVLVGGAVKGQVRACATARRANESDDGDSDGDGSAISIDDVEKSRDTQLSFALLTFLASAGLDANGEAWALLSFTTVTMCVNHLGPPRLPSTRRALRAGGALGVACSATNVLAREMRDRCESAKYRVEEDPTMIERLRRWCRKQMSHPIADELYHSSVELKLAMTNVPTLWREATIDEEGDDDDTQSGSGFDRNPATATLGRANAERADDARNAARACVDAFHDASTATDETRHAEFAVSALNYVSMQSCGLHWFARFFLDAELDAVHALSRVRAYRCTAVEYAPAVVRVRRVWYLLFPRDGSCECHGADEDGGGWRAIAAWCVYVRRKLRDAPCRGINLQSVLDDIASSSSDGA
ncbi:hypothetical protein CYMTET_49136 [Cymbomonas tetramitiformis]|uniref:Uncharacterized protein n=1 Tax=Cymbomonas tetramitiformis TaxID=36881 RepID=A0AAE0EW23_9CHLO|nr:hypothetical protein CYMTET_49136 [Cymbomonas tetramitiformis]